MIYDVIYSLLVLIEKLEFFSKQLQGFIISLSHRLAFGLPRHQYFHPPTGTIIPTTSSFPPVNW